MPALGNPSKKMGNLAILAGRGGHTADFNIIWQGDLEHLQTKYSRSQAESPKKGKSTIPGPASGVAAQAGQVHYSIVPSLSFGRALLSQYCPKCCSSGAGGRGRATAKDVSNKR